MSRPFAIDGILVDPERKKTTTATEDFKKNIQTNKRYVDKTQVLIPLLEVAHEVTFFLRPRRFGKTLTLSMIRYFTEDTCSEKLNAENRTLFEGMKITKAGAFYTDQMTRYPVISISFQSVKGVCFNDAYQALLLVLQKEYDRHRYVLESDRLSDEDKTYFQRILESPLRPEDDPFPVNQAVPALLNLSEYLRKVHGEKTVVLFDEYDVPLEKAFHGQYYDRMAGLISPMLQGVLKTNSENIQFAVVTGCLRVAKESIYTGLNNPEINTVLSNNLNDVIGFTESEVATLLDENGLSEHLEEVKEWYDGYLFGTKTIYNPWSVLLHIEALLGNPTASPEPYWAGTSENVIIRELAERGSASVKEQVEKLLRHESISFRDKENIVYQELGFDDDHVFNVMLHTGYLTTAARNGRMVTAVVPNKEVYTIFEEQISEWFRERLKVFDISSLYEALLKGNREGAGEVQRILAAQFLSGMSYYDTKEAYYHGVLYALLSLNQNYTVTSNREAGKGRFDIQCKVKGVRENAIIIEVKVSSTSKALLQDAAKGAKQARTKKYALEALREGYQNVLTYGISFFEKDCIVEAGDVYTQADLDRLGNGRKR